MGFFKATTVQGECDKAAQILKSFIGNAPSPYLKNLLTNTYIDKKKIPLEVISNAKGLAIFTGFRAGMYFAGAGGSGVVVARLPDGSWSPPSAFSVRSGSVGLVYGVDVYDCVCVLNTEAAVDCYKKCETSLGGAVALAAGPIGGNFNSKNAQPVWTYTKSRGLYGGLTVDGTVIKERSDANADFYGAKLSPTQILQGEVNVQGGINKWPGGANQLIEVLKVAEGKGGDVKVLQEISTEPTPGDMTQ